MTPPAEGDDDPSTTADASAPPASDTDVDDDGLTTGGGGLWQWRSREVVVPMRVYKTVTVFATLIAVASVLAGFVLLDLATNRARRPLSDVDAVVALAGVGVIVFGAAVYAYSTRFRAAGMGKPNSDGGEGDGDD